MYPKGCWLGGRYGIPFYFVNDYPSKENNITLQSHTTLLEFLEIPQMMDTCIKNQCYEEALELQQFSKKLEIEHSEIPAINLIVCKLTGTPLTCRYEK